MTQHMWMHTGVNFDVLWKGSRICGAAQLFMPVQTWLKMGTDLTATVRLRNSNPNALGQETQILLPWATEIACGWLIRVIYDSTHYQCNQTLE